MGDFTWIAKYRGMELVLFKESYQNDEIKSYTLTIHKMPLSFFISESHYDQHGLMFMAGFDYGNVELRYIRMKSDNPLYEIREEIVNTLKNTPSGETARFSDGATRFLNKLNLEFDEKLKMLDKISSIDFLES